MLDGRQRVGSPSRRRVRAAVQSVPTHEAHHAGEYPHGAREHAARGDNRPRDRSARTPDGRADARGPMIPPLPLIMVEPAVRAALLEDLGRAGDLTTDAIVPASARTECALMARQPGVVAGLDYAETAFRLIDPSIEMLVERADGSRLTPGDLIAI